MILYTDKYRKKAIDLAEKFRKDGLKITLQLKEDKDSLDDYISYCNRMSSGGILYLENDENIKVIDVTSGDIRETDYKLS